MAENQDTKLEIEVVAKANKGSAEQAVNDIASGVQQVTKKSRIEVPIDITVPIDSTKKKLTEAQKDITAEISKMMSEGFSASGKDIDTLISKFNKFTKAMDTAGKGRQNKIFKEIRRQVEELKKSYQKLKTETNDTKGYTSKASNTKKSTKKTAKERYLDQQEEYSKRAQGAGRKAELKKELEYVRKNKSPMKSSGNIKGSMTNDYELRASEYSFYGSKFARMQAQSAREAKKWERKSLEISKYASAEAVAAEIKKRHQADPKVPESSWKTVVVDEDGKKVPKKDETVTMQSYRETPLHRLTDVEKAQGLSNDLRSKLLPDIIKKIQSNEDDTEINALTEKFFATLKTISQLNQAAGLSLFKDIEANLNLMLGQVGYTTKGHIGGVNDSKDKTEKSKEPKMVTLLKGLFDEVVKIEDDIRQEFIRIEQSTTSKRNAKRSGDIQDRNSFANRLINETQAKMSAQTQATDRLGNKIDAVDSAIGRQTNYDKIEYSAERVADSAEATKNTNIANGIQKDLETGFNTDAKADTLINAVKRQDGSGGNGGLGGNGSLNGTGPNILEQMRDLLISINTYTTAIFDLLPKLKLTIKREKRSKKSKNIEDMTSSISRGIAAKDFLGQSMEINKVWDGIAEQFEGWIKPIREALLPIAVSDVTDRTTEAFEAIKKAGKRILIDKTDPAKLRQQQAMNEVERAREEAIEKNKKAEYMGVDLSQDTSDLTKDLKNIIKKSLRYGVIF